MCYHAMVVHIYDPRTQEVEAGESDSQDQPQLLNKVKPTSVIWAIVKREKKVSTKR